MEHVKLHHGDCLEVMATLDAGIVDAVVTDPPYGLAFMGKEWDKFTPGDVPMRRNPQMDAVNTGMSRQGGRQRACADYAKRQARDMRHFQDAMTVWAEAVYPVMKDSAYLLSFGGTRTWHRLACAIEDAGFEIRDTLMWLYGSGFPKGKSCLKPAWEPIILARKPGPMRELGIEECRIGRADGDRTDYGLENGADAGIGYHGLDGRTPYTGVSGRWPANLILSDDAPAMLDGQTGTVCHGAGHARTGSDNPRPTAPQTWQGPPTTDTGQMHRFGDSGGASRFFYCAKASRSERNAGCEGMEERDALVNRNTVKQCANCGDKVTVHPGGSLSCPCGNTEPVLVEVAQTPRANHHPTVKPVALMRWLVRLVARPGDAVLDPFMGSGTTGVACAMEGREFIGIERDAEYVEIARRRIEAASAQERLPV